MRSIASFVLLGSLLLAGSANAAKFGVRVVSESGEPMAGVAVCVGTHGNYRQFGAMITTQSGDAVVEVPNVPLVVTISKSRFTGMRLVEPSRNFNLVKEVKLHEGVPGPRCKTETSLADAGEASIRIGRVSVSEGIYSVSLKPELNSEANYYRLDSSPDFRNARWQVYRDAINVPVALSDESSVYLQMRRYKSVNGGWLEARSNVVSVFLPKM